MENSPLKSVAQTTIPVDSNEDSMGQVLLVTLGLLLLSLFSLFMVIFITTVF